MTTVYNDLAHSIDGLACRLPRIGARYADIDEVDVLARSLVALVHQTTPDRAWGDLAIEYWEERIALLLTMEEAILIVGLRQQDYLTHRQLATITALLSLLLHDAYVHRRAAKRRRTSRKGLS